MEQPNLDYINSLAADDLVFKGKLVATLKKEFPAEVAFYKDCMQNGNFAETAGIVHKLKHKISILGMEKSYYLAEAFEGNLKKHSVALQDEFEEILAKMQAFTTAL